MSNMEIGNSAAWSNFKDQIQENKTWFMILGICLIILGCVAIFYPIMASVAADIAFGWLVLFAGIMQVIHAFQTKTWSGFFLDLLIGICYVITGGWICFYPSIGLPVMTIMVGILFLVEGGFRCYMSLQMKPVSGWGWVMFSSIMAGLAGILILAGLPSTSLWVVGMLVGINFISSGWALIFLAMAAGDAPAAKAEVKA